MRWRLGSVAAISTASALGVLSSFNYREKVRLVRVARSMESSANASVSVSATSETKPANDSKPWHRPGGGFVNPWPSFHAHVFSDFASLFRGIKFKEMFSMPPADQLVEVVPLDHERIRNPPTEAGKAQLTWLGHASFLLQVDGVNVLLDPIFSHRCAPVQFMGPSRVRPPPCKISELPKADVVIISHNHYDHLDDGTITALGKEALYLVPLGNKEFFTSRGYHNVRELDWWESTTFGNLTISCTPTQHFSGRWLHDRDRTLWGSWVVQAPSFSYYFAGDTGYRTVPRNYTGSDDDLPFCPAFREIGARYGPFDLSCIPIGAYSPRFFMSRVHLNPADAVCVHRDVRSKRSIGMHWGTFRLTDEPIDEPPRRLAEELSKAGIKEEEFQVMKIGETMTYEGGVGSDSN